MGEVRNVTMPVIGMTCANCSAAIERNVRKLPGINVANVNLANEKLTVEFDPTLLNEQEIIEKVERSATALQLEKPSYPLPA